MGTHTVLEWLCGQRLTKNMSFVSSAGDFSYCNQEFGGYERLPTSMALAYNQKFELASVDIRAAFLQARVLERDVFINLERTEQRHELL